MTRRPSLDGSGRFLKMRMVYLLISLLSFLCILGSLPVSMAETQLIYQDRGAYHEGIKPKPVSGYNLELISVLVDYHEPTHSLPTELKVRFYLPETTDVHITVRELDYRKFYWLDQVKPAQSWDPGFDNIFTWPTEPVLQSLDRDMNMYDLGVLARLGQPTPTSDEHIAPVILYHTSPPTTVKGYRFTLKPNGRSLVKCEVFSHEGKAPLWSRTFRRKPAGQPFSVNWDASHAHEGSYVFLVTGYFLDTNQPINQAVHFYHKPWVQ